MKILFIAYYFPPESSSGAFRPLYFANHLQEMGHDVTILTVRREDFTREQPVDENLLAKVHPAVEICRCRAFHPRLALLRWKRALFEKKADTSAAKMVNQGIRKEAVSIENIPTYKRLFYYFFSTPDEHISWLPFAVIKGYRIIKRKNIDIVLATGGPWTSFIVAKFLKFFSKKKVVYDYRDPWSSNPIQAYKFGWLQKIELKLERWILKNADLVIANTEELTATFQKRFTFLSRENIVTITNGYEPLPTVHLQPEECLTITHAGDLYHGRSPVFFLEGVLELLQQNEYLRNKLCIQFLGGVDINDETLNVLMSDPLIKKVLRVVPRVPLEQAIEEQQKSDVLLLIQGSFPLQIPRKLYEYLVFEKVILAVTDADSATANIIKKHNLGLTVSNTAENIKDAIFEIYKQWEDKELRVSEQNNELFLNKNLTKRLVIYLKKIHNG